MGAMPSHIRFMRAGGFDQALAIYLVLSQLASYSLCVCVDIQSQITIQQSVTMFVIVGTRYSIGVSWTCLRVFVSRILACSGVHQARVYLRLRSYSKRAAVYASCCWFRKAFQFLFTVSQNSRR